MPFEDLLKRLYGAGSRIDEALGRLETNLPPTGVGDAGLDAGLDQSGCVDEDKQWHSSRHAVRERLDAAINRLEKILE